MKKINYFFMSYMIVSVLPFSSVQSSEIYQSEGLINNVLQQTVASVETNEIEEIFQQQNETVYQKKIREDLYLISEPHKILKDLDKINTSFWIDNAKNLNQENMKIGLKFIRSNEEKMSLFHFNVSEAAMRFETFLENPETYPELQTSVVYASNKSYQDSVKKSNEERFKSIEMLMCLTYYPDDPFQTHMGIVRNTFYSGIKNKNLSPEIHRFAAQLTLKQFPHKKYMITKPQKIMKHILVKVLPQSSFQLNGNNEEGWVSTTYDQPSNTYTKFSLKDNDNNVILEKNGKNTSKYDWLLWIANEYMTVQLSALVNLQI